MADSERWARLTFRPDDIVISTPPKCGTTWMQMLSALLIFQDSELPRRLTELSPWLDVQTAPVDEVVAELDAQEHRRFIKTHTPLDGIPEDERVTYVCVGRDPRDVAVSWDHHFDNTTLAVAFGARAVAVGLDDVPELMPEGLFERPEEPVDRFWRWVDDDTPVEASISSLASTLNHLTTFWKARHLPNVALFHYADLQRDLEGELRRLAAVLGIDVAEERLPALVEAATFERMRARAGELAPQVAIDGFWNETDRFFNVGASGQWQALLGPGQQARYDARVAQLAAPDLAAWAHGGCQAVAPG
jgi:hypothetical protein